MSTAINDSKSLPADNTAWLEVVRRQVGSLRFGVVQIVVHDSRVVQIERTEKVRFGSATAPEPNSPAGSPEALPKSRGY